MKKLLIAALAALFLAAPAYADDIWGDGFRRMQGDEIASDTATQFTYDWGFWSSAVRICAEDDSALVYIRLGTVAATSSTIFIDGLAQGSAIGSAAPHFGKGDGTDVNCMVYPVRATAMTFHQTTAGTVTMALQVFGK